MDPQTKSAIKQLVLGLRHTLEHELAIALGRYGLSAERPWSLDEPPARLTDPADRQIWQRIVTAVRRGMKEGRTLPQAGADYVRESAFTYLNRLVGLKCLEVRGIIDEVITAREIYGGRSKAHRDYRDEHPGEARAADDALPACLAAACRRVNDELIGYLFDPDDDHSLVWPRYAVLRECVDKINALDESAWREDEIIGWIYQFYNAEEKVAVRQRGKPQTPHEVAVINQFFTPRWVVKFLVDNTLGRLWLEMHPDSPRVRAKCDYLVPEMLPADPSQPETLDSKLALDPDSPINNPHATPRREWKAVTRIRLLDPACGTMHFGHYACEVLDAMYRDAREWGEVQIEDERIPSAILEYNLYGVDIDRRAVQLAALSLFMKARTMHPQARVRQVNLVVADATMPDSGVRQRFLARYGHDRRVQRAFAQVLEDMDQVAQVGSLLRVEERLRELLAEAGHAAAAEGLDARRQKELPGLALSKAEGLEPPVRQRGLAELVEDEGQAALVTPHFTLQELRDDLRAFARQALQEHDLNAQLFATEADKAVRLLDVLMGEYDVVVMNPPYGDTTGIAKVYLHKAYPRTDNDLYAAFFERTVDLTRGGGYIGGLTSRTFMFLRTFQELRQKVLLQESHIVTLAELGLGILDDATVRPSATILQTFSSTQRKRERSQEATVFFRLADLQEKQDSFESCLATLSAGRSTDYVYVRYPGRFRLLPRSPLVYWAPESLLRRFSELPSVDRDNAPWRGSQSKIADVKEGLGTRDDARFVMFFWEVSQDALGRDKRWVPFAKGGRCSAYYNDVELVVDWQDNGRAIKGFEKSVIRNECFYFREGISYTRESEKASLGAYYLAPDCIFGDKGPTIFLTQGQSMWLALAVLNSEAVAAFVRMLSPDRSRSVGLVASLPFPLAVADVVTETLGRDTRQLYGLKAAWDTGNEMCTCSAAPWLLQIYQYADTQIANQQIVDGQAICGIEQVLALLGENVPDIALPEPPTLGALLDAARAIEDAADARLQAMQAQIDEAVYDLYEIRPADRALIERELGNRPPELVWPQMEGKSDAEKRREHVRRLLSHYARQAVRESESGIVPLAGCSGRDPYLIDRVRAQLEAQFGSQIAYQWEQDAADYLGRPLAEWLRREFFARFHVKLYKNRPILWHLASPKGYFAVLLDYHRLTADTLPRVRTLYLWPQREEARTRLAAARADLASVKAIGDLEDELADLEACDQRLESVIQGTVKVELPGWAHGPYRNGSPPYNPDLDDGVRVNLLPIQAAGLLPVKKVV